MAPPRPVCLCILDGWGARSDTAGNAPALANTPHFDAIMAQGPQALLKTHGRDVGLPDGQFGNSEVGHTNIGAGRIVPMDLVKIDDAIADGSFAREPALTDFIATLKASGGAAHIFGLVSEGGVHSQFSHMQAAAKAVADAGVPVVIHAITDGRDVAPQSASPMAKALDDGPYTVGSITGRYYAMDRDTRWERVEQAYRAMVHGQGAATDSTEAAVSAAYADDKTDEFIPASVVAGYSGMKDGDGIFCLNFRADRARQILAAMGDPAFDAFDVSERPKLSARLGMVDYSDSHSTYMTTVYPKARIQNTLGAWVAAKGLRQFRVAETEKYPHVTFFLNGGEETPAKGEDRHMAPSPKVATYDLQPEMSAAEVTDAFVGAIEDGYDLIVCNYANPDMVGHTGDLEAAKAACEAVDQGLGRVIKALRAAGGAMLVTADHGNCEVMIDPETGGAHTAHTTNLVPVALVGGPGGAKLQDGRLADLAPTLLALMGQDQPPEMTGRSLLD